MLLYEDDDEFVGVVGAHLAAAIERDERVVVVATAEHRAALLSAIGARSGAARDDGDLWLLDAPGLLARILRRGDLDAAAFDRVVGSLVRDAVGDGRRVQVYGEMVDLLWSLGNVPGALALEHRWEHLRSRVPFSLLCAYASEPVATWGTPAELRDLCGAHSSVLAGAPTVARAEACLRFARARDSAAEARRFVADSLQAWGLDGLVEDAVFVVSELATNAVLHARSDFTVSLERADGVLRLSVGDREPRMAPPPSRGGLPTGGRGLYLVAAMSVRWGQVARPEGKLVWAEFEGENPIT